MSVALPTFVTRDGIPPLPPLDDDLTRRLLEAAVKRELHHDELAAIRAVCDRVDDPSEFLRTLIERWEFKGAGEQFMARLFSWLAGERDVLWLGDLLRRQKPWTDHVWSRMAPRRRALDLLAAVDSPLGWLEILRFRDSTRVDDLYRAARDLVYGRAREAGLHAGQEHDLAAPALAFDDSVRLFDAARGLRIVARDRDVVHVQRDDGRTFAHLPAARNGDDPDAVARSREHWHLLRPAILEVLDRGADRLERAMVTQRTWDQAQWRADWFEHPLLSAHARRIVWRGVTDFGEFEFLISNEREALRHDGSPAPLDAIWSFEVAHPTTLDGGWQAALADLEVVQPFAQVHRGGRPTDGRLNPEALAAAERWGWDRRAQETGDRRNVLVLLTGEHRVRALLRPGLSVSGAGRIKRTQKPQELYAVEVHDTTTGSTVPRADWSPLIQMEVDVLRARAAL